MLLDKWKLDGKTAIVTGGGTGIGRVISLALAEAGADVSIAALPVTMKDMEETSARIKQLGRKAITISTDIADSRQVDNMVARTIEEWGKVDILVNNAGAMEKGTKAIWEINDDEWHKIMNVNLSGTFFCCRAVAKHMTERRQGNIINIASVAGMRGLKNAFMYCSSKAGVISLTQVLAVTFAEAGIRVNAIAPSSFATWRSPEEYEAIARFVPVGHVGKPEDIGLLVVYLASGASAYVTGQVFCIDGGSAAGGYAPTGYVPVTIKD